MMKYNYLFLLLLVFSCTEKMVVIPEFEAPDSNRVLLVEEFTGASCPGCPAGAEAAEELLQKFPGNIVVIAVHSDFQGSPAKSGDLDLRTQEANDIETLLGGWFAKPEASINRKQFSGEPNIRLSGLPARWDGFVQSELESFSPVELSIASNYNDATRELEATISAVSNEIMSGSYEINVLITESDIITAQKNVTTTIEKYKQKHVLRTALTDIDGSAWFANLGANLTRERTFNFTLPDEEAMGWWVPENCYVVAFITDASTGEVVQAAEVHVVE